MADFATTLPAVTGSQVYSAPKAGRVYTADEAAEAVVALGLTVLDRERGAVVLDAECRAWQVAGAADCPPMLRTAGRSMFVGLLVQHHQSSMFPLTVLWAPSTRGAPHQPRPRRETLSA